MALSLEMSYACPAHICRMRYLLYEYNLRSRTQFSSQMFLSNQIEVSRALYVSVARRAYNVSAAVHASCPWNLTPVRMKTALSRRAVRFAMMLGACSRATNASALIVLPVCCGPSMILPVSSPGTRLPGPPPSRQSALPSRLFGP